MASEPTQASGYPITPQDLITRLSDAGYTPQKIEAMLGGRISYRAFYRWKNGEVQPQRKQDYYAVYDLAAALKVVPERVDADQS